MLIAEIIILCLIFLFIVPNTIGVVAFRSMVQTGIVTIGIVFPLAIKVGFDARKEIDERLKHLINILSRGPPLPTKEEREAAEKGLLEVIKFDEKVFKRTKKAISEIKKYGEILDSLLKKLYKREASSLATFFHKAHGFISFLMVCGPFLLVIFFFIGIFSLAGNGPVSKTSPIFLLFMALFTVILSIASMNFLVSVHLTRVIEREDYYYTSLFRYLSEYRNDSYDTLLD